MSEVQPRDVLLRIGGKTLLRHGVLAVGGAGRKRLDDVAFTFTRADATTCATYIDRGGILRLAAANVPRIEWVDLDGDGIRETAGIVLQGSRTNLAIRSKELDNAAYVADVGITVTANNAQGPDGATTAETVDFTGLAGRFIRQTFATATPETRTFCLSFAIKAGTASLANIRIIIRRGDASDQTLYDGPASWVVIGTPTNGLQRYYVKKTFSASAVGDDIVFGWSNVIDAAGTIVLTDVQLEEAAFPSSTIPTTTAAVTRAADSLIVSLNQAPPAIGTEYTIDAHFMPAWPLTGGIQGVPGIYSLGGTGTFAVDGKVCWHAYRDTGSANLTSQLNVNEVGASSVSAALPASGAVKLLTQLRASDSNHLPYIEIGAASASGATRTPAGSNWRLQELHVGNRGNGNDPGHIVLLDLKLFRGRFTRAEVDAVP